MNEKKDQDMPSVEPSVEKKTEWEEDVVTVQKFNPSQIFILRPIATSLIMVAIFLSGLLGFRFLPLSALPQVDYPTIEVTTLYPGASADVMGTTVTAPLERELGEMPGLVRMSSVSGNGVSAISLQFGLDLSLDVAEQEVQAAINAAGNLLPSDLPSPPIYAKVNPADAPILTLALSSDVLDPTQVEDIADNRLASRISQLPGVGLVTLSGGQRPAIRIKANSNALASYGLSLESLRSAISAANVNGAKGSLDGPSRSYAINANDQLIEPTAYEDLIIAYRNGSPVRLKDVGSVIAGVENKEMSALAAWKHSENQSSAQPKSKISGASIHPAILLNIQRQPGANVIAVADNIKKLLPRTYCISSSVVCQKIPSLTEDGLPKGLTITPMTDRTLTIRASVHDVEIELGLAVCLVIAVIFVFLRNVAATLIAGLAVPLSLVGAFSLMYLYHFSINNLSLMALTIASGFVVDDAIVMIENINRYLEKGYSGRAAALEGAREIGFTIISLTISLLAVLIPLVFMGDVVGRLFREFAISLGLTIIISAIVSLTLVPSLCGLWFRKRSVGHKQGEKPDHDSDGWLSPIIAFYDKGLQFVLRYQTATLIFAVATFLLTLGLYITIPKGLFPTQDVGQIQAIIEATPGTSYDRMQDIQAKIANILVKDKAVNNVSAFIGVDGQNTNLNTGRLLISLKPLDQRHEPLNHTLDRLKKGVLIPGVSFYMQPIQDLTIDTQISKTQYQFVLEGIDFALLKTWSRGLIAHLKGRPEIADLSSDAETEGPVLSIDVDRATAGRLGISMSAVDNALYDSFGQRMISTIFTQSKQYRVILEAGGARPLGAQALSELYLPSSSGGSVPLNAISKITETKAPLSISHVGQFPAVTLSFNLGKGYSLGQAVSRIKRAEREVRIGENLGFPESITTTFLGAAGAFQASLANEIWLILAAIVTIYIVLGVLYESFIHPITILSTLPSATVGALIALELAGQDLGVIGVIGLILLFGIVKKNAILMIDFALEAERHQGLAPIEAIKQAAILRFRPILMTTIAALFGAAPLVWGGGYGAELRQPLGIAIIGGLIVSQILTLFTTPVIYLAFDRLAKKFPKNIGPKNIGNESQDLTSDHAGVTP